MCVLGSASRCIEHCRQQPQLSPSVYDLHSAESLSKSGVWPAITPYGDQYHVYRLPSQLQSPQSLHVCMNKLHKKLVCGRIILHCKSRLQNRQLTITAWNRCVVRGIWQTVQDIAPGKRKARQAHDGHVLSSDDGRRWHGCTGWYHHRAAVCHCSNK